MGGKHTLTYLYLKPPPIWKKNCNNNGDVNGLIWKPREHNSFHTSAPLFNYAVVMCRWTPVLRDWSLFVVFTVRPVIHMHVPNTSSHARSRSVSRGRCAWEAPSLWCSQWRSERCVCARRVHALHANLTCSKPTHSFFVALLASFSSLKIFPESQPDWNQHYGPFFFADLTGNPWFILCEAGLEGRCTFNAKNKEQQGRHCSASAAQLLKHKNRYHSFRVVFFK